MQRPPNLDFFKACRDCGAIVYFSNSVRAENGSRVPLEKDGRRHTCRVSDEALISQAYEYIASLNRRLSACHLKLVREERQ